MRQLRWLFRHGRARPQSIPRGLALARELLEQQAVGGAPLDVPGAVEWLQVKLSCSHPEAERLVALVRAEGTPSQARA